MPLSNICGTVWQYPGQSEKIATWMICEVEEHERWGEDALSQRRKPGARELARLPDSKLCSANRISLRQFEFTCTN